MKTDSRFDTNPRGPRTESFSVGRYNRTHVFKIVFPDSAFPDGEQVLNCKKWLVAPKLLEPIANAFMATCSTLSARTRRAKSINLADGLFAFVEHNPAREHFDLGYLNTTFFNGLIDFIGSKNDDVLALV